MSLEEQFQEASGYAEALNNKATNDELLNIYGFFKQATIGDCNTAQPSFFDMRGRAKWTAWNSQKGKSQDVAKEEYIKLIGELKTKYAL